MPSHPTHSRLVSSAANDPEICEVVAIFVSEMPGRIRFANEAFMRGDRLRLQFWAHQLKGCAGGYGFAQISTEAAGLEETIVRCATSEEILTALLRVTDLCERTTID